MNMHEIIIMNPNTMSLIEAKKNKNTTLWLYISFDIHYYIGLIVNSSSLKKKKNSQFYLKLVFTRPSRMYACL